MTWCLTPGGWRGGGDSKTSAAPDSGHPARARRGTSEAAAAYKPQQSAFAEALRNADRRFAEPRAKGVLCTLYVTHAVAESRSHS